MEPLPRLLDDYLAGIELVTAAVADMNDEQLSARPVAGKWSTREVLCHIADSELVFADRMKRIIAEDAPALPVMPPDRFMASLACRQRDVRTELALIAAVRRQAASILSLVGPSALSRTGVHSVDGPVTLEQVLAKAVRHLRHHVGFIREKRKALGLETRR